MILEVINVALSIISIGVVLGIFSFCITFGIELAKALKKYDE